MLCVKFPVVGLCLETPSVQAAFPALSVCVYCSKLSFHVLASTIALETHKDDCWIGEWIFSITDANAISQFSVLAVSNISDRPISEFVELLQPCLTSRTLRVLIKETSGYSCC